MSKYVVQCRDDGHGNNADRRLLRGCLSNVGWEGGGLEKDAFTLHLTFFGTV